MEMEPQKVTFDDVSDEQAEQASAFGCTRQCACHSRAAWRTTKRRKVRRAGAGEGKIICRSAVSAGHAPAQ